MLNDRLIDTLLAAITVAVDIGYAHTLVCFHYFYFFVTIVIHYTVCVTSLYRERRVLFFHHNRVMMVARKPTVPVTAGTIARTFV